MKECSIFLSYAAEDGDWAKQFSEILGSSKILVQAPESLLTSGERWADQLREAISTATHVCVLIGAKTRFSKWVDREIELSTEPSEARPGAALVGIILPSHEDFSRPYYEPENVPIRLHDLVQSEYALIRKWNTNPEEIIRWLDDAAKRRDYNRPEPSFRAARELYKFSWDRGVDASRPSPEAL